MIESVDITNYRALRRLHVDLRPLNVIVGPNDTGKTCFLQALETLKHIVTGSLAPLASQKRLTPAQLCHVSAEDKRIDFGLSAEGLRFDMGFRLTQEGTSYECVREHLSANGSSVYDMHIDADNRYAVDVPSDPDAGRQRQRQLQANQARHGVMQARNGIASEQFGRLSKLLSGIRAARFEPVEIARPVALIESSPTTVTDNGFGVAHVLLEQRIAGEHFDTIKERLCKLLPSVDDIRVRKVPAVEAGDSGQHLFALLEYRLGGTTEYMPGWCMSEGVLLLTAYVVSSYETDRPRVLLIEEPESGVHPGNLEEIYNILKAIANGEAGDPCQVILTTHSPYLPDYASPDEVIVFARDENNEIGAARLSDLPEIELRTKYFSLGELIHTEGEQNIVKEARPHASAGGE